MDKKALSLNQRELLLKRILAKKKSEDRTGIPRRENHEGSFPVSWSQKRLWFMEKLAEKDPDARYNFPVASTVDNLDPVLYTRALNLVILRHEILRTVFSEVRGEPVQRVLPRLELKVPITDLCHLQGEEQSSEIKRIYDREARKKFTLEGEPLIRASLISLGDGRYFSLIIIHHIIYDDWSQDIFEGDLAEYYTALKVNRVPLLKELPIQYADFTLWQNRTLESENHPGLRYWKELLDSSDLVLELPLDKTRPKEQSYAAGNVGFSLSREQSVAIKKLCHSCACTPFMFLLAVYKVFLYRYTGQKDIIVGVPSANRSREETEDLIGFFVNMLPLKSEVRGDSSFISLLRSVKELFMASLEHQEFPFEKLVETLHIQRDISRPSVFQVSFNFVIDNSRRDILLEGQTHSEFFLEDDVAKYDLTLVMTNTPGGFRGNWNYNRELFHEESVVRMSDHFQNLVNAILSCGDMPIASVPMMPEHEAREALIFGPEREIPRNETIISLFEKTASRYPRRKALAADGVVMNYKQLNAEANQTARYLISRGVKPGDVVGLWYERCRETVVLLLGILKAGAAYLPIDEKTPAGRVKEVVETAGASLVLVSPSLEEDLKGAELKEALVPDWQAVKKENKKNLSLTTGSLMYVMFTSGTTGKPRGVTVTHRNFLNYILAYKEAVGLHKKHSSALVSTFASDLGSPNVWGPLITGGCTHILSYECSVDPRQYESYFSENRIDVVKMVPGHLEALSAGAELPKILPRHSLILAGEAFPLSLGRKIQETAPSLILQNHYGPTETTVSVLMHRIGGEITSTVPLGKPIGNMRAYVVNENFLPVPPGVQGELILAGESVSQGYINNPEADSERFLRNFPGEELVYKTGDRVSRSPDGVIFFHGRTDDQVKIRGYRVDPGEVAQALLSVEGVYDSAVTVVSVSEKDRRLAGYYVSSLDGADILKSLKEILPEYMVPSWLLPVAAIPLTPNGKLDKKRLPPLCETPENRNYVPPETPLQKRIVSVWQECLGQSGIGIDDDFFESGGDSFKSVTVMGRIDKNVSVMALFKNPTPRKLAAFLESECSAAELLYKLSPDSEADISVVCIPFAGGRAITFKPLAEALKDRCHLYALELPGHDSSCKDQSLLPFDECAKMCIREMKEKIQGPILLYSHCINSAMAVLLAEYMELEGMELKGVFTGGSFPSPRMPGKFFELWEKLFPASSFMSRNGVKDMLKAFGALSGELDKDELAHMTRCMQHDRKEAEDYFTRKNRSTSPWKLKTPVFCVIGEQDRMTEFYEERYSEWGQYSERVELRVIPGAGHYFHRDRAEELAGIIADFSKSGGADVTSQPVIKETEKTSLKAFLFVMAGQIISMIGSGLTGFATGIWVFQQTGSVSDLAVISVFALLPGILALPFAGALADRYSRRKIMIFSDIAAALSTGTLALLVYTGNLMIYHFWILASVGSLATAFQRPAFMAAVTQLVPKKYLGQANGLAQLANAAGGILAPLMGGFLVTLIGLHGVILVDLSTFAVGILVLFFVRFPNTLFKKQEEPVLKEIAGGVRYILKRKSMVAMTVFFFLCNFLFSLADVLVMPLVYSLGSAAALGAAVSSLGLGLAAGSLVMTVWGGFQRRARGMIGFIFLAGAALVITGLRPSPLFAAAGLFLYGAAISLSDAHWASLIQVKVGLELQGRVFSSSQLLAWIMRPAAYLMAGPLADRFMGPLMAEGGVLAGSLGQIMGTGHERGIGVIISLTGVLVLLWTAAGRLYRPLYCIEDRLPDTSPGSVIEKDKDRLQEALDREYQKVSIK